MWKLFHSWQKHRRPLHEMHPVTMSSRAHLEVIITSLVPARCTPSVASSSVSSERQEQQLQTTLRRTIQEWKWTNRTNIRHTLALAQDVRDPRLANGGRGQLWGCGCGWRRDGQFKSKYHGWKWDKQPIAGCDYNKHRGINTIFASLLFFHSLSHTQRQVGL